MPEAIKVAVVDDQPLIRMGFRMVLDADPSIEVVGEASDGASALELIRQYRTDVVLMDVRMPSMDGIEATRRITAEHDSVSVVVLTTFDLDEYAFGALRAGASGFLLKDANPAELVSAIKAAHAGDATLSPRVTRRMIELFGKSSPADEQSADVLHELTEREHEVFVAMARGLTNAEIATALFVSESTVKTHVGRVLAKLNARDRVQAVILAHRLGIAGS